MTGFPTIFNVDSVCLILSSMSCTHIFKFPHEPTRKLFLHSYIFFYAKHILFFTLIILFIINIFINDKYDIITIAWHTHQQTTMATSDFFLYNSNDKTSISNELAAQQQWLALVFPPIHVSLTIKKFLGIWKRGVNYIFLFKINIFVFFYIILNHHHCLTCQAIQSHAWPYKAGAIPSKKERKKLCTQRQ
jgi:hypothetical protein